MENINTILENADRKYNVQKLNEQLELEQDSLQIKELLGQDVIIETDKVIRNAIKNGNICKHKDGSKYILFEGYSICRSIISSTRSSINIMKSIKVMIIA